MLCKIRVRNVTDLKIRTAEMLLKRSASVYGLLASPLLLLQLQELGDADDFGWVLPKVILDPSARLPDVGG